MIDYDSYQFPSQLLKELSNIEDADTFNEIIKRQITFSQHSQRKLWTYLHKNKNLDKFFDEIYTNDVFKLTEIKNFINTTNNKNRLRQYSQLIYFFIYHNKEEYLSETLTSNNYILFIYKLLEIESNLLEKYIDNYEDKYELFHYLISINHIFTSGDYTFGTKYTKILIKYISYLKKTEIKKLLSRIDCYNDENYRKIFDYVKSTTTPLQFINLGGCLKSDEDIIFYINKIKYNKEHILLGLHNIKNNKLYFNLLFEKRILNSSNINEFYLYLIHDAKFVYLSNKSCFLDDISIIFIEHHLNINFIENNIEKIQFYNSQQRFKIHMERLKYINRYIILSNLNKNL